MKCNYYNKVYLDFSVCYASVYYILQVCKIFSKKPFYTCNLCMCLEYFYTLTISLRKLNLTILIFFLADDEECIL